MAVVMYCNVCLEKTPHSNRTCLTCKERGIQREEDNELERFQSLTLEEKLIYLFKNLQILKRRPKSPNDLLG